MKLKSTWYETTIRTSIVQPVAVWVAVVLAVTDLDPMGTCTRSAHDVSPSSKEHGEESSCESQP